MGLAIFVCGTVFFYQSDRKRFADARNQGVDVLSEKNGVVTARDRKTGKIVTLDMNDIEKDQVNVDRALGKLAEWVPRPPGGEISGPERDGSFSIRSNDSHDKLVEFYDTGLIAAGIAVKKSSSGLGKMRTTTLSGSDVTNDRVVSVVIKQADTGSLISITTDIAK